MNLIFDKLKEKPHNCPFCGALIKIKPNFYTHNYCFNHGVNIRVAFQYLTLEYKEVEYIVLSNNDNASLRLYLSENDMFISNLIYNFRKTFPLDNSITPENFEEKINFYLIFS
jgi:hypothetical protein